MTTMNLDTQVRDIAANMPGAAELFRQSGISFCCGGKMPLAEAAKAQGLEPEALLAQLFALQEDANREAPTETLALIDYVLDRYHETHRRELESLIPLAQRVETVHGDHDEAPLGITAALIALHDELDSHMMKEEQVLFPIMRAGNVAALAGPLAVMRDDHHAATDLLRGIEHASNGLTLPEGACGSWTALYTGLRKLGDDLVAHIHLEETVLFPRFEPEAA
ncbi:iron-sulfur cluster repair di-iron protein [Pseudorhodobacter aquimaris]|uniref:iron-sulfur cluster repair di-iron protein n=1 Tax=Pseudorhodobacter aquimaris TaxID=687412 RepID=UPI00067CAA8B|nr:iron-sulfur cluster repair di-iron protein [Pseudorhodobacter aquimaris]